MKIEFQCSNCKSLLRLPREYIGRKARCPVCGNIEVVKEGESLGTDEATPFQSNPSIGQSSPSYEMPTRGANSSYGNEASTEKGRGDFSSPPQDNPYVYNPYATPQVGGHQANQGQPLSRDDGLYSAGLVLGILSIVLGPFGCCFCFGGVIGGVGLTLSILSKSPNRKLPIVLNAIGLGLGFVLFGIFVLAQLLGGM